MGKEDIIKELKMLPLSVIEPNDGQLDGLPKNPRSIKKKKFEKLKQNIEAYPEMLSWRSILVYPLDNGHYIIIGGNMRYRAMQELGHAEAPCVVIPKDTTVEQLQAYTIIDNNGFGDWDWDLLANEWNDEWLDNWGLDIPTMSNDDEEVKEDDFDDVTDEMSAVCAKGDIWQLGGHRLMCGDSTSQEQVAALMGGEKADMWLTDPPYNVNYEGYTKDKLKISNDSMSADDFHEFLVKAYTAADASMKAGASFYIWHADREGYNFRSAAIKIGWTIRQCLIWNKNFMVLGRQDYQCKHEPCLYGWKGGGSHNWYGDRKQTTVIDFDKPMRNGEHPTMKPVGLFGYLLNNSSKRGDRILDSFGGSGTTIIACEELGRIGYAMELDPHYCDVIIARWEKLTGKQAIKIN